MISQVPDHTLLKNFEIFYESLVDKVLISFKQKDYIGAIRWITAAASAAWEFHPGRFSDARLERVALWIGENLTDLVDENISFPFIDVEHKKGENKRVLHVATRLYSVGGHTRLITNWIKKDTDKEHWLVVTQQDLEIIPQWLIESFEEKSGRIIRLPDNISIIQKSLILRKFSQSFDFIILHQHPWDVIPLLAFAVEQTPPVAVMNHADHAFWLGVSVADLVLDLRSYGTQVTLERRKARRSQILPIPLETSNERMTRDEARKRLKIDDDKTILLSIGSDYKYAPTETHNFFKTAQEILNLNPSTEIYIIGPQLENVDNSIRHERMHILGIMPNPILYKKAADIYLEGFPMSSFTALLETVKLGVCPVLMYLPNRIFAFDKELAFKDLSDRAISEREYIEQVTELLNSTEKRERIAETTKENILYYHCTTGWKMYLDNVYNCLEQMNHQPQLIERTASMREEKDYILARLRSENFRRHNQPSRICWFSKPEIYNQFNMRESLLIFWKALYDREVNSLTTLRWWLAVMWRKWKALNTI